MIHVYVGPTLPASEPVLAVPGVRALPPARHGDFFDTAIGAGDTVVLIDGVYHQAPALRHKEILAVMGRGVVVVGAASIGALRAAELAPFGMVGVGPIFTAYLRGEITGDDEVAVGQAPDGSWDALTWPLVNLRHVLELAESAGVVDGERALGLLEALRAVYYPQRTWAAVRAVCRRQGETGFAHWLARRREEDRHFGDLKRADALAAVSAAVGGTAAAGRRDFEPLFWETPYFRRWSNAAARRHVGGLELATEDCLVYQQVFDPAFSERWTAYLEHRSRHGGDSEAGLSLAERLAGVTSGDLTADRVFHPPVNLHDEQTVALLLAGETRHDRQAVSRYASSLEQARRVRPGFSAEAVRDDLVRELLVQVWRCPESELDAQASARGLVCAAAAVQAAKRLVPGFLEEIKTKEEATHGGR
ncbi:TfuA-like protein [Streptomyces lydicus]|uniref:TfuA-like protein n=1 Tax=Streptomyces lydicus TaxID=47763 RepID=UPI0010105833|nr:TfuA-like protein [Streptomyces lydicus]MCZ1012184.1 TfuA-like protein [Streptomyces lydicus]